MKTPKTYFSTEFQGGQRALRGRLKNLMAAAPRRRGMVALALLLVAVVLGGACLVFLPAAQGEKESSHSDPLAALPEEARQADEGYSRYVTTPDGAAWYLFTRAEGDTNGGGVLRYGEAQWQWIWPAEGGTEEYAAYWADHLGYLSTADCSIDLMAPLGEIAWAPDHTQFFYETVFGTSPDDVLAGVQTYMGKFSLETESQMKALEPVGRYVLNETTADVYRLAWETLRPGGAPSDFYEQEPAYLVFARPYGESTDQYEYRGSTRALDQIDGMNAAVQVVYGVSDAEYTLRRDGYPGYSGLGGDTIRPLSEGDAQVIPHKDWDPIYQPGDYWEEVVWDALTLLRYVNGDSTLAPGINKIVTTRSDFFTYRGISVGATREEVLTAYPEASAEPNWAWEGDFLWWQNTSVGAEMSGLGQNLIFYFEDDTVTRMELIDMFD